MENEQLEAKNRLDEIKRVLVDSDKTIPTPQGMFYAIGIATIFLDIAMDKIFAYQDPDFTKKLSFAIIMLICVFFLTVFTSKKFVIKENEKLDRVFSKNQRFIFQIYCITIALGIAMTIGVATTGGWALIYFYWMAIMGMAAYVFGFFTKKIISKYGLFLIFAAIAQIIAVTVYNISMNDSNGYSITAQTLKYHMDIYALSQYSSIILVGLGHIVVGYILGKTKNV